MTPEGERVRWWLELQIGLATAGGLVWLSGAILDVDFVAGAGLGLLISALVLRVVRQAS